MEFGREWDPQDSPTSSPEREDVRMAEYFREQGGLLFTQVNIAYRVDGRGARYVDGVRIINPPRGEGEMYSYGTENREAIWTLLENHHVDVIEVHDWGFDVLGHCLGKATLIEEQFDPPEVEKTVIVADGAPNDPPVEREYKILDVDWKVITP